MNTESWIALFKRLPAEIHNQLVLTTSGGTEMAIQTILSTEGDFSTFKGRLAGSQETGRLFFLPLENIDYVGFNRLVSEEEYRTWFTAPPPAPAKVEETPDSRTTIPNRAALLERIRSRATPGRSDHGETPKPDTSGGT